MRQLEREADLRTYKFNFPTRPEVRFSVGPIATLAVIQSLRPSGYFSHYTACLLHGLTVQRPRVVYLNAEQTPKPQPPASLSQGSIDRAMRGKPRVTTMVANFKDIRVTILNGKATNNLGVEDLPINDPELGRNTHVQVTDRERTLIDIAVRPFYSGGPGEVLEAFRLAKEHVRPERLVGYLRQLSYVYPYHQVIGFYMTRAGYKTSQIKEVERIPREFDFYLTYSLKTPVYDEHWRLFFPKGL